MRQLRQLPVAAAAARRHGHRAKAVVLRLSHRAALWGHAPDRCSGRPHDGAGQAIRARQAIGVWHRPRAQRKAVARRPASACRHGHLQPDSEAFGALKLTGTARGVLKGETEVMLREQVPGSRIRATRAKSRRGDIASRPAGQGEPVNATLLGALRTWRSAMTRQRGVPAYVVLHDATIEGIASARPTTSAQLRGIPGIGDKKLEHYGDELLALVRATEG